jgi:hypothetical protein
MFAAFGATGTTIDYSDENTLFRSIADCKIFEVRRDEKGC